MMAVRASKFADIIRLTDLMRELHQRSTYAQFTLDEVAFRNLCINAARLHGKGGGCLFVAEHKGVVEGFIIGAVSRLYNVGKEFEAHDVFFYHSDRGHPRDADGLVEAFHRWAETLPNVVEINMGATNAAGDSARTAKLYRRRGMTQNGVLYQKRIER
jgi:hypothetical protein